MLKILFLPLDERPCNYRFPAMMCKDCSGVELLMPPREMLGYKKQPADTDALMQWLLQNAENCDAAVISVDMLLFGGIVPSRLHHWTKEECLAKMNVLRKLRQTSPKLKIYAFSLILRAPAYSSSEEEPDYYATWGRSLFELGLLYRQGRARHPERR